MTASPTSKRISVRIRDESFPRTEAVESLIRLSKVPITARDLIAERVRSECDRTLAGADGPDSRWSIGLGGQKAPWSLMQSVSPPPDPDPEREIAIALTAFESNGFVLLVDDIQVETLDEPVSIKPESVVTFLKLTPLVGG